MDTLTAKIEAILFMTARPVSFSKLAKMTGAKVAEVKQAVEGLSQTRNVELSGIHVVVAQDAVELGSNPSFADVVSSMSKEETEGELTRPQLETLTIVAYRGPITRAEIEYIRGVNCAIILRNLLMRGLIVEKEDANTLQGRYTLSTEMLRHLGVRDVSELPDFEALHTNAKINQILQDL